MSRTRQRHCHMTFGGRSLARCQTSGTRELRTGPALFGGGGELSVQRRVDTGVSNQVVVAAVFDDTTLLQHEHDVGVADRAEAMRDNEGGATAQQALERL